MGYSMRLELTRVFSLNDFQLVMGLYRGHPLFFLEAWVGGVWDFTNSYFSSVCVCECVFRCVCVYICVYMRVYVW